MLATAFFLLAFACFVLLILTLTRLRWAREELEVTKRDWKLFVELNSRLRKQLRDCQINAKLLGDEFSHEKERIKVLLARANRARLALDGDTDHLDEAT
jgi:hypothetical protein